MSVNLSDYFKIYFGKNLRDQLLKATSAADEMLAPSSRLLQKRREAMEVNNAMTLQREDFESTLRALRIRKDELIEKEGQMKEYLQKFDNFLKENEVKRCRAVRKAGRERELTNQKKVDLLTLQEEMKALVKERDRLEKRVQKNAIYPHYLDKVVQASEQFQEARQVMSRYDTLMLTREDLVRTTQQNQDSTENVRAQLARFTEQSNDTLLHYNNTLAQLQSQLDKARAEGMIWESRWAHIQNTAAKKTLLLGTIKMATLNLYQCVCKRAKDTGESPIAPEDTIKQLEKIQTFLADLICIWEEVNKPDQPGPIGHR
ncbi:coiled-coil domain-containing protein 42 [Salmo salar]|uniref:Coiled-coil domain-containing protein 42 n=1 Tax=Salmo salar TaxID=8030 RepID=A0A1S3LKR8_SALSA|nr:coiled-coil domain-containing protein 42-like [Salmo salar]|eukprot:XP_013991562.1 PREDICTED: coiled-coil domain-containing protein 42A-like [Salmo salar]